MIVVVMMDIKIERIVVHLVLVHVVARIKLTGMVINFIIRVELEVVLVIIITIVKVKMKNDIIETDINQGYDDYQTIVLHQKYGANK